MLRTALTITETVSTPAIGSLRRRVASAVAESGAEEDVVAAVRVCVSEALGNAVLHGYPEQSGIVDVVVEVDDERVVVIVRDGGQGFGSTAARGRDEGRMGLEIIRKLTEHLKVTSESGTGTELRMTFVPMCRPALDIPPSPSPSP